MPAPSYHLQVVTPQGRAFEGDVVHARVPVPDGSVGVLANHAPYITSSLGGTLEVRGKDGREDKFAVGPGFFEVLRNQAIFLTQSFNAGTAS
ncbi:MAG TPA: F0F1 ATP synthase subunit epsilon [Verrucomicrobiae bacterium]|nr:F0F1 ATP synthase subunit epsilon [Verrucomicrobiae bacterium]